MTSRCKLEELSALGVLRSEPAKQTGMTSRLTPGCGSGEATDATWG